MRYLDLGIKERAAVIKVAVKNGYRNLDDILAAYNKFDEGGFEEQTQPALNIILKHLNSLDRKYEFIANTWDSEFNGKPKGYDKEKDLYFPYSSAEGGTKTIGPGLKLRKEGKGDKYSFTEQEVANGVTKKQIDEKLGNNAELLYNKVLEFLNLNGNKLPYDTISPSIMNGLMDLRYQSGSLGKFGKLRNAVLNGDIEGIKKESRVFYKRKGKVISDERRNQHRVDNFWHYSTGGPIYPFSFVKGILPEVRY